MNSWVFHQAPFYIISCCFLYSCKLSTLPYDPSDIAEIRIGTGANKEKKDAALLNDDATIKRFIGGFTFSAERDYTVKHRLNSYVEIHLANGKVAYLRFENRLMRYDHKEYTLSETTAKSLKTHMKQALSNKAL